MCNVCVRRRDTIIGRERVREDAEVEVVMIVVCPRPTMRLLLQNVLQRKRVHVYRKHSAPAHKRALRRYTPYLSASALSTSQLTPPTLIQRTFTHGSRLPAPGSSRNLRNSRLLIRPKLLRVAE